MKNIYCIIIISFYAFFINASAVESADFDRASQTSGILQTIDLNKPFERIISLGSDCVVKKEINEYFNPSNKWLDTKKGHADIFDWMLMHDLGGLTCALQNKLEGLFGTLDVNFNKKDQQYGNPYPYNHKYNMGWKHMFHYLKSDGCWGADRQDLDSNSFCIDALKDCIPKYNFLKNKFLQSKNFRTLYYFSEYRRWNAQLSVDMLKNLRNAIITIRGGNENFILLIKSIELATQNIENIFIRKLESYWYGGTPENSVLKEFNFTESIWD